MEVDDVEIVGAAAHLVEHGKMRGDRRFQRMRVEPQRLVPDRHQPRGSAASALANSVTS